MAFSLYSSSLVMGSGLMSPCWPRSMQEPHQAQMLQTGNGVNEFRDPGTRKKRPSVNPAAQIFKAWRLRRGSSEEPFDDPVVGLLSAWQARQFSSDRYAGGRRAKASAAFLFLDQISASISSYRFRAPRRRRLLVERALEADSTLVARVRLAPRRPSPALSLRACIGGGQLRLP